WKRYHAARVGSLVAHSRSVGRGIVSRLLPTTAGGTVDEMAGLESQPAIPSPSWPPFAAISTPSRAHLRYTPDTPRPAHKSQASSTQHRLSLFVACHICVLVLPEAQADRCRGVSVASYWMTGDASR